jgi:hypothetical protein
MNNVAGLLKEVIRKYKLEQPVPDQVRSYLHAVKRSVLVDVLRKSGNYGFYFGLLLRIYFLARKMGIAISLATCTAAFWIFFIAAATSASFGAYAITTVLQDRDSNAQEEMLQNEEKYLEETVDQDNDELKNKAKPTRMYKAHKKKGAETTHHERDKNEDLEEEGRAKNIPTL